MGIEKLKVSEAVGIGFEHRASRIGALGDRVGRFDGNDARETGVSRTTQFRLLDSKTGTTKEVSMATISRYEFMGSWIYFWLLCITGIGLPVAVLYLLNGTVHIREQVDDAERIVSALRTKH